MRTWPTFKSSSLLAWVVIILASGSALTSPKTLAVEFEGDFPREEMDDRDFKELKRENDQYLQEKRTNDSDLNFTEAMEFLDEERGILQTPYEISSDEHQITLAYLGYFDIRDIMATRTLEADYSHVWRKLDNLWWTLGVNLVSGEAEDILGNEPDNINNEENSEWLSIGWGPAYRFKWWGRLFSHPLLYENIHFLITYNTITAGDGEDNFQGYGLRGIYDLTRRWGKTFGTGLRLNYQWAIVERDEQEFASAHLSVGFFLRYYF